MKLIVAPLHEVAALTARHQPSHLISLASPGPVEALIAEPPPHRLDLWFNDIAEPREGLTPPGEADVVALMAFADSWDGTRPLLVHCWAGVSRSTAAAYVIACARSAPGREALWARRLRVAAPTATPNPLIVALADRLLNRDGAMSRAAAAIGRGAETAWGAPFILDLSPEEEPLMTEADLNARHAEKMKRAQAARARMMASKTVERGLVIVHTGTGKGKTTAAFGMVCRMIGHGMKTSIIQFIKGAMETGEQNLFDAFPDLVEMRPMGEGFTWDTQDRAADIANVRRAWEAAKARIMDPDWKMVVCDELNIALRYDYLPVEEVLAVLAARSADTHVVITGRNAPDVLIEAADLVTDMQMVKHPFRGGVKAQAGVEF